MGYRVAEAPRSGDPDTPGSPPNDDRAPERYPAGVGVIERRNAVALGILSLLLASVATLSLDWRMQHDAPLMLYFAFLIDELGKLPYRDFFEHQPIGAHALHWGILKIFGTGDLGIRICDLLSLAGTLALTYTWMAPLGRTVAWAGAVMFGLAYLGHGPKVSLQRDYLMLLPIAAALCVSVRLTAWSATRRAALTGLLLGVTATVKPQVGLLLPAFALYYAWRWRELGAGREARDLIATGLAAGAGLAAPSLLAGIWLWATGSLAAFLDIVSGYWPLFASLDGFHRTIQGMARVHYSLVQYGRLGGHTLWLAPAALGAYLALFASDLDRQARGQVVLLAGLCFSATLFTAASGRFWDYHWLLFLYFLLLLAALCFVRPRPGIGRAQRLFPLAVVWVVIVALLRPPPIVTLQLRGGPIPAPNGGRVDEIAAYLERELRPGDTVQPIDWTGGAIHAMLIARAEVATPWVTDFQFYHHVSDPYIQKLRAHFVADLARAKPRFIVRVGHDRDLPRGRDASWRIEGLEEILARDYRVDAGGDGYTILRRKQPESRADPQEPDPGLERRAPR